MLLPLGNFIHLISWCGNFVERRSFRIVSGESPETMLKLRLQNLYTRESGEITAFFRSVSRKSHVDHIYDVIPRPNFSNSIPNVSFNLISYQEICKKLGLASN